MSDQITTAFINDYANMVQLLSQETESRLFGAVSRGNYMGKDAKVVEQFGSVRMQKRIGRNQTVSAVEVPQDARWLAPDDYYLAIFLDNIDQLRAGVDLQNPFVQAGAAAVGRKIDDIILSSMYATARIGQNGSGTQVFDTGMDVSINVGGTDSGLNLAKIDEGIRLLQSRNVRVDREQLYMVVTSVELAQLKREIEVSSAEYRTQVTYDERGVLSRIRGVNLIHIEFGRSMDGSALYDTAATSMVSSGDNRLPLFVPSALHFGQWDALQVKIEDRTDMVSTTQIKMTMSGACTRVDEDKIVRITSNPAA